MGIARVRPKRSHWTQAVLDRAQEIYNERPTPSAAAISELLSNEQKTLGNTPSESTIRDWIAKRWITMDSEFAPWSIANATAEEARLVLPVVKFLAEVNVSRRPSRAVARWVAKIAAIRTDIPPERVLELAFLAQSGQDENTRWVEDYLAGIHSGAVNMVIRFPRGEGQ